ncbi:hypothetical protein BD324DRAFT_640121 [Kockovaella imperatae]|uniref:Uncharacterized protein n=1 Tax=Kockovaella imperatae TaxID=4999 RepID=A0A1Y1U5P4_9TREE|nr:hypothetical protein BD324DRAFT_640121 [Kockovaella imperatae]ORX33353.1 hypothetical protein BD324DRAFT_640121 [Kockovaella imperatae]
MRSFSSPEIHRGLSRVQSGVALSTPDLHTWHPLTSSPTADIDSDKWFVIPKAHGIETKNGGKLVRGLKRFWIQKRLRDMTRKRFSSQEEPIEGSISQGWDSEDDFPYHVAQGLSKESFEESPESGEANLRTLTDSLPGVVETDPSPAAPKTGLYRRPRVAAARHKAVIGIEAPIRKIDEWMTALGVSPAQSPSPHDFLHRRSSALPLNVAKLSNRAGNADSASNPRQVHVEEAQQDAFTDAKEH